MNYLGLTDIFHPMYLDVEMLKRKLRNVRSFRIYRSFLYSPDQSFTTGVNIWQEGKNLEL
jgi:hypothetical protein